MPVEIRELVIKTRITASDANEQDAVNAEDIKQFKNQLLDECKKMITKRTKKSSNTR